MFKVKQDFARSETTKQSVKNKQNPIKYGLYSFRFYCLPGACFGGWVYYVQDKQIA